MSRKAGERVHNKVVFKEYNQKQGMLPLDIETLIPENHMVRIISRAIDEMDLHPLIAQYPGGGRASFHPAMMTKLIVYAYSDKIYSSRRIEKAARENIMYMWLCRGQAPDFKTINTFRSERCETRFFRATGSQYREPLARGDQSRRRGAESHRSKHKYKEPPSPPI